MFAGDDCRCRARKRDRDESSSPAVRLRAYLENTHTFFIELPDTNAQYILKQRDERTQVWPA